MITVNGPVHLQEARPCRVYKIRSELTYGRARKVVELGRFDDLHVIQFKYEEDEIMFKLSNNLFPYQTNKLYRKDELISETTDLGAWLSFLFKAPFRMNMDQLEQHFKDWIRNENYGHEVIFDRAEVDATLKARMDTKYSILMAKVLKRKEFSFRKQGDDYCHGHEWTKETRQELVEFMKSHRK